MASTWQLVAVANVNILLRPIGSSGATAAGTKLAADIRATDALGSTSADSTQSHQLLNSTVPHPLGCCLYFSHIMLSVRLTCPWPDWSCHTYRTCRVVEGRREEQEGDRKEEAGHRNTLRRAR